MAKTVDAQKNAARRPGRPEVLTKELALDIVKMIELFPDMEIDVSWENIVSQIKLKFGLTFGRRVLSTKEWENRTLIAEAYVNSREVQKQLRTQPRLRINANMPRRGLQSKIATLTAKLDAAKIEIEEARVLQYDQLDIFRVTRFDLRREMEQSSDGVLAKK